jgi:hypothetical protein
MLQRLLHYSFVLTMIALSQVVLAQPGGGAAAGPEGRVATIFANHCVHCHSGPDPQRGLSLAADRFYSNTVGRASTERPDRKLVEPRNADSSYLVMKLRGAPGIVGRRMPIGGPPLSDDQIAAVAAWINGLSTVDDARIASESKSGRGVARPFSGWKIGDLPTTRMLGEGNFLFLIEHRFVPPVSSGLDGFFGIDGGANIMLNLGYAPIDELMFILARSNVGDDLELQAKYRPIAQTADGFPLAVALAASLNVETEERDGDTASSRVRVAAQLPITRTVTDDLGVALVPGILFNPALDVDGESPLITLGVGGQWHFYRFFSLFGEWTPIVSGYTSTSTFGLHNRYDSWTAGLDIALGGHDFQVFVGNSVGTTTDQYMRGGDLDIGQGDLRIGFNIYRVF